MTELFVVRHALPDTDPAVPPEHWPLGPESREAARRLARALPPAALVLSSDETRAAHTAAELVAVGGGRVELDARLREARRPSRWYPDYRERAHRYVLGQVYSGWEPHETVARRFDAAVQTALKSPRYAPLVIVSHGLALTLWLQGAGAVADGGAFWKALTFPDAWRVSVQPNGHSLLADAATRITP